MHDIRHHLSDALLLGHAAGALSEAFDLVVATHVSVCDDCRAKLGAYDALGGALLEDMPETAPASGSLAATLDRLPAEPPAAPAADADATFPEPLRRAVGGDLSSVRWRRIGGGVAQAVLTRDKDGASARLLRIPAGVAVPDHGHNGAELTLVLRGAFHDEVDSFGRGDVEIADPALSHQPVAARGEDCICLAATDAPLRFNAFLPRLAQGLFGI